MPKVLAMVHPIWRRSVFGLVHPLASTVKLTEKFSRTRRISDLKPNSETPFHFGQIGKAILSLWSHPTG